MEMKIKILITCYENYTCQFLDGGIVLSEPLQNDRETRGTERVRKPTVYIDVK
jgi:hypothetical protein